MADPAKKWKPGELAQLRRLWATDTPLAEIGAQIGRRSRGSISNMAKKIGLPPRGNGGGNFRHDQERDARLTSMWLAGEAQRAIAEATGIDISNLWYHVARLKLPARYGRGKGAVTADKLAAVDRDVFRTLWNDRVPEIEIADHFGITVTVVRYIRNELNLSARSVARGLHVKPRLEEPPAPPPMRAVPRASARPAFPPHPFWTPERDAAVLRTNGRYVDVATLAALIGKPSAAILQRWHKLRVA